MKLFIGDSEVKHEYVLNFDLYIFSRERMRGPMEAVAICKYQSKEFSVQKDEICSVRDNSNKLRWKVTNSRGQQGEAPGAMFVLR